MAKKTQPKLPNKPSELILLALADLVKVERSKNYVVDMGTFHTKYDDDEPCHVCLAGAVMAKSLSIPSDVFVAPRDFESDTKRKLLALDRFRQGWASSAFIRLKRSYRRGFSFDREITPYEEDPRAFKREMRRLAADLASENL
jgi:hypothetical protein